MTELLDIKPETAKLVLLDPRTNAPIGLTLLMQSPDEPGPKAISDRLGDVQRKKSNRNKILVAAEIEAAAIEFLAACIVGFEVTDKTLTIKGKAITYTNGAVAELLAQPWARRQVDEYAGEAANFFRLSPMS